MQRFFLTILACALPLHAFHATAHAETQRAPYDARRDRLEGFDKDDLARIDPLLAQGPVALVEFADMEGDQLPAINVAVLVDAPPRMLETVVTNPVDYARFMPALDSVDLIGKHGNVIVYDWSFDLAVLQLSGRNVMTVYSAPVDRPDQTTRVTIDSENGDLGRGRFLLRIVPYGIGRSVLVLSMRLDLREANYVARQLAKAARSVNRSANLALAVSMALHIEREAERRAGSKPVVSVARPLTKPEANPNQLWPLLNRGDLLLLATRGDQLDQIGVLAMIGAKRDKVHAALSDARAFGAALIPGSVAEVVAEEAGVTTFDWDINLPLVGLSGRMRMASAEPVLAIDATAGALHGGSWRFELAPFGKHATFVTGWARFDFKKSTWLLEKMVSADAYVGHGMSAASEVMLVRALRSRATKP
jgi:carbon monoxide dehydrogenase subunit G